MKKITLFIAAICVAISFQANAQYTVLTDFSNTNLDPGGANPDGILTLSIAGDTLFGMTQNGGKYSTGSVFYITYGNGGYDTLHSFTNGNDGGAPQGSLTLIGKRLYGMAFGGGINNKGVIFSIKTNGTGYDTLHSFGWAIDGYKGSPIGSLTLSASGTTLYGMTIHGGIYGYGNIFSINVNTGYDTLYSFSNSDDGGRPYGNLTLSATGDTLFGMTSSGGLNNDGVIFSIKANGTGYDTLHSFGYTTDGGSPHGSLTRVGNVLYGITSEGGQYNDGIIFHINSDGTGYDTLHNFGSSIDYGGGNAQGSLTLSPSGKFYGVTYNGGYQNYGSIFSLDIKSGAYDTLYSFEEPTDGGDPLGENGITLKGDTLFGTLANIGTLGYGTIFKFTSPSICNLGAAAYSVADTGAQHDGTASVIPAGGSGPYTYAWAANANTQTTATATGLSAGTYTCTVTDHHGCSATTSATVTSVAPAGINNISSGSGGISIYPNPSNGQFTIVCHSESRLRLDEESLPIIQVYNVLGEQVYTSTLPPPNGGGASSVFQMNLSSQPGGIYLYRVITNSGELIGEGKIIVQR